MKMTNFDSYLEKNLENPAFAARFSEAGAAWEVALQIVQLREAAGLSQKELADRIGSTQQQISRLESASYDGHSLRMLRRVADALGARVKVELVGKG